MAREARPALAGAVAGKKRCLEVDGGLGSARAATAVAKEALVERDVPPAGWQMKDAEATRPGCQAGARLAACSLLDHYEAVLLGAALEGVSPTDCRGVPDARLVSAEQATRATADQRNRNNPQRRASKAALDAAYDAVQRDEQFTQVQMRNRRQVTGAMVLMDPAGCTTACIGWAAARGGHFHILLIHTRWAWRRQQLAEIVYRQFVARHVPVGGTVHVEAACGQAGEAAKFWHRMKFVGNDDAMAALQGKASQSSVRPGEYAWTWTRAS